MFGWQPSQLVGRNIGILMPEHFHIAHKDGVNRSLAAGKALRGPNEAIVGFAQHRMGLQIPVVITLIEVSKEPWIVTARLNPTRRDSDIRYDKG